MGTACNGLIAAPFEETQRKDWPEAFFGIGGHPIV